MTALARSDWDEVCARVRREEDPFFHDPWLDRIAFVTSDESNVVLATPNRLYLEFIQENLDPILNRYLRDMTHRDWHIAYQLREMVRPDSKADLPAVEPVPVDSPTTPAPRPPPRATTSA